MSLPREFARPLPESIRGRPSTAQNALRLGVSASRIRGRDLRHAFHGVIVPVDWGEDCLSLARAYAVKMLTNQYFSHATAAVLHDMRLPRAMQLRPGLHVTTAGGSRALRGKQILGHVGNAETIIRGGLRLATPLATWCQLGSMLNLDDLVIAGDGLLSRKDPTVTMAELQNAVAAWQGSRGYRNLLDALSRVRARTDSARETMLRLLVVRAGLPEPMVNVPVRNREGRVVAHADLAFPEFNLVLEYDGDQHRTDQTQYYIDIDRLERITREGWRVIRINRKHMQDRSQLARVIGEALADAGWNPPKPRRKGLGD